MPKLSDLLTEKAKADVPIGGSVLKIEFYVLWRERFSKEEWDSLLAQSGREHYKTLLPRVMLSWDLENGDGHVVPVSADAIEEHHIPDDLLVAVGRRIAESDLSGKAISRPLPGT